MILWFFDSCFLHCLMPLGRKEGTLITHWGRFLSSWISDWPETLPIKDKAKRLSWNCQKSSHLQSILEGETFFSLFLKCFPLAFLVNICSLIIVDFENWSVKKGKTFLLSRLGAVCCNPVYTFTIEEITRIKM